MAYPQLLQATPEYSDLTPPLTNSIPTSLRKLGGTTRNLPMGKPRCLLYSRKQCMSKLHCTLDSHKHCANKPIHFSLIFTEKPGRTWHIVTATTTSSRDIKTGTHNCGRSTGPSRTLGRGTLLIAYCFNKHSQESFNSVTALSREPPRALTHLPVMVSFRRPGPGRPGNDTQP